MKLSEFNYNLPKELIAQYPLKRREAAKLLLLHRKTGKISHHRFYEISNFLKSEDILVLNNTKVFKARLKGKRETGGSVEIFLIKEVNGCWEAMVSHAKRIKENARLFLDREIYATVREKNGSRCLLEFNISPCEIIKRYGIVPLPHYIKRAANQSDEAYYQTIFAKRKGSIAAPTAGLHFTEKLLKEIQKNGTQIVEITLHVGPGTFIPIRQEAIESHEMEAEYFEINKDVAAQINNAKRVLGVGTSVCRALESFANIARLSGLTDLFIYPGYKFKIINGLVTNFHQPCSTPLLLVCAFAKKDLIFKAYNVAIKNNYRFLSYGDAMLII